MPRSKAKNALSGSTSQAAKTKPTGSSGNTATPIGSQLTAFSPESGYATKFFAQASLAVNADTVRVYDVEAGQCTARWASASREERVSAMIWVELESSSEISSQQHRGKKRRKSGAATNDDEAASTDLSGRAKGKGKANGENQEKPATPVLALGLVNGDVVLLHPTSSAVLQTLHNEKRSGDAVASLSYTKADAGCPALLWSLAKSGTISQWQLGTLSGASAKLRALYSGAVADSTVVCVQCHWDAASQAATAYLLIGLYDLRLYRVDLPPNDVTGAVDKVSEGSLRQISSCSGHTTKVRQLSWLSSLESATFARFASLATADRHLHIWKCATTPQPDSGPNEGALVATLTRDSDIECFRSSPVHASVVVLSQSGDAATAAISDDLFEAAPANAVAGKKRRQSPIKTISPSTQIATSGTASKIIDAQWLPQSGTLRIAQGAIVHKFSALSLHNSDGSVKSSIDVAQNAQAMTGSLAKNDAQAATARAAYSEGAQAALLSADKVQPAAVGPSTPAAVSEEQAQPILAERLKMLELEESAGKSKSAGSEADALVSGKGNRKRVIANASSLSASLVQALHSGDAVLLETCLQQKNLRVIRNTVKRVPDALVVPLIEGLSDRLARNKRGHGIGGLSVVDHTRGQLLLEWLRCVFAVHLAHLLTVPSLVTRLAPLQAILDARLSCHTQLMALNGKLDLAMTAIELGQDRVFQRSRDPTASAAMAASVRRPGQPAPKMQHYVEGQEQSESSSSSDDSEAEDVEEVQPAEEGSDIEDLVLQPLNMPNGNDDSASDSDEKSDSESEAPSKAVKAKLNKPQLNGFLDLEAQDTDDNGSDEDGLGLPNGFLSSRKKGHSDDDGDGNDSEDLDHYESDFINDDESEEDEEEDEE